MWGFELFGMILLSCMSGSSQFFGNCNASTDLEIVKAAAETWKRSLNSDRYQNFQCEIFQDLRANRDLEHQIELLRLGTSFRWKETVTKSSIKMDVGYTSERGSVKEKQCYLESRPEGGNGRLTGYLESQFLPLAVETVQMSPFFGYFLPGNDLTLPQAILDAAATDQLSTVKNREFIEFKFRKDFFEVSGKINRSSPIHIVEYSVAYDQNDCPYFQSVGVKQSSQLTIRVYDLTWKTEGVVQLLTSMKQKWSFAAGNVVVDYKLNVGKCQFGTVSDQALAQTLVPDNTKLKPSDAPFECVIVNGEIRPALDAIPQLPQELFFRPSTSKMVWVFAASGIGLLIGAWYVMSKQSR